MIERMNRDCLVETDLVNLVSEKPGHFTRHEISRLGERLSGHSLRKECNPNNSNLKKRRKKDLKIAEFQ